MTTTTNTYSTADNPPERVDVVGMSRPRSNAQRKASSFTENFKRLDHSLSGNATFATQRPQLGPLPQLKFQKILHRLLVHRAGINQDSVFLILHTMNGNPLVAIRIPDSGKLECSYLLW